ncbi:MAG TPA: YkgJ family cysteine cluster protein, partial [Flavisolibacter sp.]|nr:YkgJ family cysteine cluster protein [Flavisolibacter sp.]
FMSHYRRMFSERVAQNRSRLRRFLTKIEKNPPLELDQYADEIDKSVWSEVNCLACSNCCRTMTPTYTFKDLQRISKHLNMTIKQLKEKWLYKNKKGEWMNVSTPCQFLNLKTNMCSIYAVRPDDCAGFPHLTKKKVVDYIHIHKQNVHYCPATYTMVEKLIQRVSILKKA